MNRSLLIASAIAAALSAPVARAEGAGGAGDQPIDEKCYGVSPADVSVCGSDAQSCAWLATPQQAANGVNPKGFYNEGGEPWAFVPKGTCVKIYGGSLTKKTSS